MRIVPEINKDVNSRLREITCFALDMDGTIYLGEQDRKSTRLNSSHRL